jgi:hypothetical protein
LVRSRANDERAKTSQIRVNYRCSKERRALRWRDDWLSKRNMKSCHFRTPRTPAMSRPSTQEPKSRTISETYVLCCRELQRLRCATRSENVCCRAISAGFTSTINNGVFFFRCERDAFAAAAGGPRLRGRPEADPEGMAACGQSLEGFAQMQCSHRSCP